MPTVTAVDLIIIKVPFALWTGGVPTAITLEPAMTTFITTATALTVDGIVAAQELHSYDYTTQWERLEFVATSTNIGALETAAATLQTSLTSLNSGVTVVVSAWAVTPTGAVRVLLP